MGICGLHYHPSGFLAFFSDPYSLLENFIFIILVFMGFAHVVGSLIDSLCKTLGKIIVYFTKW